ncbi:MULTISPECIES: hypothetical protein [Rothia]|uniref:hypothetical protein n=1 Tax=Rothia TaxID=32207 RepID=UPI001CAF14C9|nr:MULTISPECIES: hypothetical protein [Rothia]MBF1654650.1 hypothetical protein [Rothia sp. (in: high G+C Gram-positive bacteria)]
MSTNISRRKVVAGAAWAAPVVAASAVVPAFASSTECEDKKTPAYSIEGTSTGAKTVQKFKVPANVDKINFVAIGGPGGTQYPAVPGGASAQISGTIAVKEGQLVEIVAAAGGVGNFPLDPSEGGEGYGNGGSSKGTDAIPASVVSKVDAVWPKDSQLKRRLFSSSGGGSSAVLIDGVPVAVAGGGGGVGVINAGGSNNERYVYSGAIDAGWWKSNGNRAEYPYMASKAGSASGLTGGAGEQGYGYYTEDHSQQIAVEAGKGGAGGIGGTGGTKTALPTGKSPNGVIGFSNTNNQELYASSNSGNAGGDGFAGAGADGVPSYSYEVDNNDRTKKEEGVLNGKPWGLEYDSAGHNFNGYQSVYSAGGGAGYGGGGSGASTSAAAIILTQKWNNNPNGIRQNVGFGQLGGGGGAGGSYLAPDVTNVEVGLYKKVTTERGKRTNGSVVVSFCERS